MMSKIPNKNPNPLNLRSTQPEGQIHDSNRDEFSTQRAEGERLNSSIRNKISGNFPVSSFFKIPESDKFLFTLPITLRDKRIGVKLI